MYTPSNKIDSSCPLWTMRFPKLRLLSISRWNFDIVDDFFLAHSPDQFSFRKNELQSIRFCTESNSNGKHSLGIRALSGDPDFLHEIFMRYPTKISPYLCSLTIVPMSVENKLMQVTLLSLEIMLEQLYNDYPQPPLPALTTVMQAFTHSSAPFQWDLMDSDFIFRQLIRLVKLAPRSLESWKGAIIPVPGLTPEKLAEVFEHSTKIKDICISTNLVPHHGVEGDYAFALTARCPSLKEVTFENFVGMRRELKKLVVVREGSENSPRIINFTEA